MDPELEMNLLRRQNLGDSLRRSAQAAPDKPAVIFYTVDGASQTCSYAQLNTMVNAVANNLQRRGVKKGDRVAALSRNGIPFLALGYALHKIGAWLVPVNFMLQPHDVQHLIEFAEAKWFFVEDALLGNVDAVLGKLGCVEQFVQFGAAGTPPRKGWIAFDALLDGPASEPEVCIEGEDVASMFFTSGTESAPKGVLSTHTNFHAAHLSWAFNYGLSQDDRFLLSIPLIHMAGYLFASFGLANQVTLVMTQTPQPVQMIDLIERHRLTAAALPPTLYVAMLSCPNFGTRISAARQAAPGRRRSPKSMVDGWKKAAPDDALLLRAGFERIDRRAADRRLRRQLGRNAQRRWPLGRPADVLRRRRAPGRRRRQGCRRGRVGRTDRARPDHHEGLLQERRGQPARVPRRLVPYRRHPVPRRGRQLLLRRPQEGHDQDRRRERCIPQKVESVLGTHAGVMQCAVLGLPDERWGEAVTAAVIARPGVTVTEAELVEFCRDRLPGFEAPKRIHFRSSLPISAANKILKKDLKTEYANADKGG